MNILRKYASAIMLILFCWYYGGISFSTHTHIVNGVSILHSHPGGAKSHTHSESQFALIDIITCLQATCPDIAQGTSLVSCTNLTFNVININDVIYDSLHNPIIYRGPPLYV